VFLVTPFFLPPALGERATDDVVHSPPFLCFFVLLAADEPARVDRFPKGIARICASTAPLVIFFFSFSLPVAFSLEPGSAGPARESFGRRLATYGFRAFFFFPFSRA